MTAVDQPSAAPVETEPPATALSWSFTRHYVGAGTTTLVTRPAALCDKGMQLYSLAQLRRYGSREQDLIKDHPMCKRCQKLGDQR